MATFFSNIGQTSLGCLGDNGRFMFCLLNHDLLAQRIEHSLLYIWDNGKLSDPISLNWTAAKICYPGWEDTEFVVVGKYGRVLLIHPDGSRTELDQLHTQPAQLIFRDARVIASAVYMVGSGHKMFCLERSHIIKDVSVPAELRRSLGAGTGFEAVDGFHDKEIYAVGWEGEIWCFDGLHWSAIDSPSNLVNTGVVCGSDQLVYVVGQMGTVIKGRNDQWTLLTTDSEVDLWDVAEYEGAIYVCSMTGLFRIADDGLEPVALEPPNPTSFSALDSTGRAMLSVGADDVVLLMAGKVFRVV